MLPTGILKRGKMGFAIPLAEWFRTDLREMACDLLLSQRALQRGYFKAEGIRRLLDDHLEMREDHGHRLWSLLFLELWFREYVDGE